MSVFFQTAVYLLGQALLCLSVLLVIAFACYCLFIKYRHKKYDHIPGPPRESFLFGHALLLQREFNGERIVHETFLEWAERYGPVCRINVFHLVAILITSPEGIKEILMSPKYPKDPFYDQIFYLFGTRFLGKGLLTDTDHDHWYKQRRIMDPAFNHSYLRGLMGPFNDQAEILMEKLEDLAESHTSAHMHHLINCTTLGVIAKVAFGMDLNLLEFESPFPRAIELCLKGMVKSIRNPFMTLFPWNWKFMREVKDAVKLLRRTGEECIRKRQKAILDGEEVPRDILTQILKTAKQEGDHDHELMLDNFLTFFIAGQETTANQLSFAVMELARLPEILNKLRREVDDVLGVKRDIDYEDLGKLTYLSQVLKETLRMYPTAPGTNRLLPKDMVVSGVHIPGGSSLMFSSYANGRMDTFFKDPLKFDPERFHPDAEKPYFSYFPFALGPRSCLGKTFAQMEAKVILAKLIQRFEFRLVPGQSFEIMDAGSLRPQGGVICTLKSRSQTN